MNTKMNSASRMTTETRLRRGEKRRATRTALPYLGATSRGVLLPLFNSDCGSKNKMFYVGCPTSFSRKLGTGNLTLKTTRRVVYHRVYVCAGKECSPFELNQSHLCPSLQGPSPFLRPFCCHLYVPSIPATLGQQNVPTGPT